MPVATYVAESTDGAASTFVSRLEHALASAVPELARGRQRADDATQVLGAALERRTLLVVDDFHVLSGTPAEAVCERVTERASPFLTVLVASRSRPAFNLSRLRASGALLEIGSDDLRFRSWEVERLFRDVYREPLPPEALADLTRRTEGWAAGLQLFHLATQGKPTAERRRTLAGLGARGDLVREYLARNVVDDLPRPLRLFLLETCFLTRLSGPLCDAFLGQSGSEEHLRELERRQIFIQPLPDGTYRYHEVLRAHLEAAFVESAGEVPARERYRRAGSLFEESAALPDALRAYCRAEAWAEIGRLLGRDGEQALETRSDWIALLPPSIVREDPWLLAAAAREERSAGRLARAVALYQEAERLFAPGARSAMCVRERRELEAWLEPGAGPRSPDDPLDLLRQAVVREPLAARRRAAALAGPAARLTGGLSALLAGHASDAAGILMAATEDVDASPALAAAARVGLAVALLLAGERRGVAEAERAGEEAERVGSAFLLRLSRSALALEGSPQRTFEATAARVTSEVEGDAWGCLAAALLEGLGALAAGNPAAEVLDQAVRLSRALGAGVLEAWARAALALAAAGDDDAEARQAALQAEVSARVVGAKGAQGLAYVALARCDPAAAAEYEALARAIEEECGLVLPVPRAEAAPRREAPPLELRCFAGFSLAVGGKPVDLSAAKPRARRALRRLALAAGRPVHREALIEALWPGGDVVAATRHLHVLISTLRRVLEPGVGRGESHLIVREGEAYRLVLPPGAFADVVEFDAAVAAGRAARGGGDGERAVEAFQRALDVYTGDLLPEDGPADWVVDERDLRRAEACEAACALAETLLGRGEALSAAVACERGLHVDRYEDALWRTCIAAYEHGGDAAAAERTRRKYERVLAELGLSPTLG
jgi:DNA-binding SARP family transcriptional activator